MRRLRWRTVRRATGARAGRRSSSGWNATARILPCLTATGWPSTSASTSTPSPVLVHPRRADEHRAERPSPKPCRARSVSKRRDLAAEGVAAGADVEQAQVVAVEHDQSRRRYPAWACRTLMSSRSGSASPSRSMPERHRGGLAAGDHERVESLEVGGRAHARAASAPSASSSLACASKSPWMASTPTVPPAAVLDQAAGLAERGDLDAGHRARPGRARRAAMRSGSSKCVVASTIGGRGALRVLGLEDARADEDALGAQLHHQRGVGRGGDAAGGEVHHGQLARARPPRARGRAAPGGSWRRWAARTRPSR